jgi:hypothetical protein
VINDRTEVLGSMTEFYAKACGPMMSLAHAQADLMSQMMQANLSLWHAAIDAAQTWTPSATADREAMSPCLASTFADLQECQEALMQAQIDALKATRRSAT